MKIIKEPDGAELWLVDIPVTGKCDKCQCIFEMDPEVDEIIPGKVSNLSYMHGWASCPKCGEKTILTDRDKT